MTYTATTVPRDAMRSDGKRISLKMDAVNIAKGTIVLADASAGYATNTPTASRPYFGVAYESVDNSGGSAGDLSIEVETTGVFAFVAASADQTWVGKECWMSSGSSGNNSTVVISDPGLGPKVGRVVEVVSATLVRVLITGYAMNTDCEAS